MCFEAIQWFSCRCPIPIYVYCHKYPKDSALDPNLCIDYSFANKHLPYRCPACSKAAFEEQWAKQDTPPVSKTSPEPSPPSSPINHNEPTTANSPPQPNPQQPYLQTSHNKDTITHSHHSRPTYQPPISTSSKTPTEATPTPSTRPRPTSSPPTQTALHWLTPERAFLWQRHQQEHVAQQQQRQWVRQEQERVLEREGR